MEQQHHRFSELFKQLGLPSDPTAIGQFIRSHAPLPGTVRLEDAPFWTPAQARLLCDALARDSDWAEVVDQLNNALR